MKIAILDWDNKQQGEVELKASIFELPMRKDILQRVVEWQRAKRQAGTHKTKEIGDISGTTKKPFKQKGTGNARQGSLRSPQFRKGATIFGPVVRSHAYDLPKKIRALGLKTALSAKAAEGNLIIVKDAALSSPKTSDITKKLNGLSLKSALVIDGEVVNDNFAKAIRNVKFIDVLPTMGLNVYDVLRHEKLVLTEAAVKKIEERLS
jgi:large subunit ribosomal protein L4